jgi:hypothetical protein
MNFLTRTISTTRLQNSCGSLWLRFVLVLTMWQGPIPWVHCHGTVADSSVSADMLSWFSVHLRSHHACVQCERPVDLGWHTHFDMPQTPADESDRNSRTSHDCLPASHLQTLDLQMSVSASSAAISLIAVDVHCVSMMTAMAQTRQASHFYASFAPAMSLPARFCIARC